MGEHRARLVEFQILAEMSLVIMLFSGSLTVCALSFNFSSFQSDQRLQVIGNATINSGGVVYLTLNPDTSTTQSQQYVGGQLLYTEPISFKNPSGLAFSFSTSFTFQIRTMKNTIAADGMAFMIVPRIEPLSNDSLGERLGLMRGDLSPDPSRHLFAVEFDTYLNIGTNDPSSSHVGIDIDTVNSSAVVDTYPFAYGNESLYLYNGYTFTAWIDYNKFLNQTEVRMAQQPESKKFPHVEKPEFALTRLELDLSTVFLDQMHVGFSSATGLGYEGNLLFNWEFSIESDDLGPSPATPFPTVPSHHKLSVIVIIVPVIVLVTGGCFLVFLVCRFWRNRSARLPAYADAIDKGPRKYSYRQLKDATNDFDEERHLASGASASVYKGSMRGQTGDITVAVKRMKDPKKVFEGELEILSRLRHPNVLKLQGWCHEKNEAFLVYDYMPRGSLDQYLSRQIIAQDYEDGQTEAARADPILTWEMRKQILIHVATALEYLHTEYLHTDRKQIILHRDVKAANVLLDENWNAYLGDFGFARAVDAEKAERLTCVGTPGYAAPEMELETRAYAAPETRGYAASEIEQAGQLKDRADVYSFGILAMEVICGRRVVVDFDLERPEQFQLRPWIEMLLARDRLVEAVDPKLRRRSGVIMVKEGTAVLQIAALQWSNTDPLARPSMTNVRQQLLRMFRPEAE